MNDVEQSMSTVVSGTTNDDQREQPVTDVTDMLTLPEAAAVRIPNKSSAVAETGDRLATIYLFIIKLVHEVHKNTQ